MSLALDGATQGDPAGIGRRQIVSALVYVVVVVGLAGFTALNVSDLIVGRGNVDALGQRLADLDARARAKASNGAADAATSAGSPFLEAPTVTLAGAALQQRIESAVAKAGGVLLSEQVDLDGANAKDGFINLTANLEIAQPALQPLLYDLEAGMPYLFIETLDAQSPLAFGEAEDGRMRVTIALTGKWEPTR